MCTTNMQYESKRIVARLDRMPLSAFHYKMLCVNGIAWAFDAFDVGIVTFVVAALTKEWGLNAGNIGILLSSGMAGMILGAFLSGPMADKFGRKAVFKWTLLLFSVFSLLCAITTDFWMLVICRFFVGIGLGGETPVVTSLLGEFIPAKDRGKVQGLLNCFWAIGWIAATAVSYYLIPTIGWRWAFVAGAVPAIYMGDSSSFAGVSTMVACSGTSKRSVSYSRSNGNVCESKNMVAISVRGRYQAG